MIKNLLKRVKNEETINLDNVSEVKKATKRSLKWSFLAEIFSKLAIPLSTIFLARILTPEIYGISTAVTIVVSFCEMITDGGFSKFLIQHKFKSEEDFKKHFNSCFLLSICFSILLIIFIFIFRRQISALVGNQGYDMVLVVSSLQIPITSLNALYIARLKRSFCFKILFYVRLIYCITPFIVTIPLALLGLKYWSLVIGTIASQCLQFPILLLISHDKVHSRINKYSLKKSFTSSLPMILESTVIWACAWTSTIIAANFFDQATVGIVKTSNSTVNSIFMLFSTAFTSVLFPSLSRLVDNKKEYQNMFFSIQSATLVIMIPLGVGLHFYSGLVTDIFLGDQWKQATFVIGVFCLTKPLMICFNNFTSEVFRSYGHFYSSILYQLVLLGIDLLLKFTVGRISFEWFVWTTALTDIIVTIICFIILKLRYGISLIKQLMSLIPSLLCCALMIPFVLLGTYVGGNIFESIIQACICAVIYLCILRLLFPRLFKNAISYLKRNV